jgi:hypothetical protein
MSYIDLSDQVHTFFASQKRKRGRPSFGTRDPKLDQPLREAARLILDGKAKSRRAALMKVLGTDDPRFSDTYRRLNKRISPLRRAAERAKEFEDNDPRKKVESFDPDRLKDADIGTYALINQNSADWEKAGRAGWCPVEGFGDGEMLIRRDLRGLLVPGSTEMAAYLEQCVAYFARIGLADEARTA